MTLTISTPGVHAITVTDGTSMGTAIFNMAAGSDLRATSTCYPLTTGRNGYSSFQWLYLPVRRRTSSRHLHQPLGADLQLPHQVAQALHLLRAHPVRPGSPDAL
jgi:hypothetical protein